MQDENDLYMTANRKQVLKGTFLLIQMQTNVQKAPLSVTVMPCVTTPRARTRVIVNRVSLEMAKIVLVSTVEPLLTANSIQRPGFFFPTVCNTLYSY